MRNAKLFETHVSTRNLERAIEFYESLDLEKAFVLEERRAAFFYLGNAGNKEQMLGIWEVSSEKFTRSHFAFHIPFGELRKVPAFLRDRGYSLSPSFGLDTSEPIVHAWMPAASYYFEDPDGNSLEYISSLDGASLPELGAIHFSTWVGFMKDQEL